MENNDLHLQLESDHPAEVPNPPVIPQSLSIRLSLVFDIKRGRAFRHFLLAPIGEFDVNVFCHGKFSLWKGERGVKRTQGCKGEAGEIATPSRAENHGYDEADWGTL